MFICPGCRKPRNESPGWGQASQVGGVDERFPLAAGTGRAGSNSADLVGRSGMYPPFTGMILGFCGVHGLSECERLFREKLSNTDSPHLFARRPPGTSVSKFREKCGRCASTVIYLAIFTPNVFVWPLKWKGAFLQQPSLPSPNNYIFNTPFSNHIGLVFLPLQMWQPISSAKYQRDPPPPAIFGPAGGGKGPSKIISTYT